MTPLWRCRRFATSVADLPCDPASIADGPHATSTSWEASASNVASAGGVRLPASESGEVSENPFRVLFLDSEGPQRVCQRLLADHVPGLVVEKLFHLEGSLPRILNGELGPVEGSVLLVQLRGGVVLFLRVVEASEIDAERGEGIAELRVLAVQVDRFLVETQDFVRLDFRHSQRRFGFPEERARLGRIGLRRLVEVFVRGIVIKLSEGLFARADVVLGGGSHAMTA